jgi:hypothetical protein
MRGGAGVSASAAARGRSATNHVCANDPTKMKSWDRLTSQGYFTGLPVAALPPISSLLTSPLEEVVLSTSHGTSSCSLALTLLFEPLIITDRRGARAALNELQDDVRIRG